MRRRYLAPFVLILVAIVGCTSTRTTKLETGMFDDQPERILDTYEMLSARSEVDVFSKEQLEAMGFSLKAPNVESIPGSIALRRVFGDKVFQGVEVESNLEETLPQLADYRGFVIPYRNIRTMSSRLYFSEQQVVRQGENLRIIVLFHGDQLCYHQLEYAKIDTFYSEYAFAQALVVAIKGPGKLALKLLETLAEYESPGLEFIAPIPIAP